MGGTDFTKLGQEHRHMAMNAPFTIRPALAERCNGIRQIHISRKPAGAPHDRLVQINAIVVAHYRLDEITGHGWQPYRRRKLYLWNGNPGRAQPLERCDRIFIFHRAMANVVADTEMTPHHRLRAGAVQIQRGGKPAKYLRSE